MNVNHLEEQTFDVAIIGAGPAGSTTAITLMHCNPDLRVCLVDFQIFPRDKACGDGLSPGVRNVLLKLGLDDALRGFEPVTELSVTGPNGKKVHGSSPQTGLEGPLGYVIPRFVFDDRLRSAALDRGVHGISGARLHGANYDSATQLWSLDTRMA